MSQTKSARSDVEHTQFSGPGSVGLRLNKDGSYTPIHLESGEAIPPDSQGAVRCVVENGHGRFEAVPPGE